MSKVRGKLIKGVEIELDEQDARELAHTLELMAIECRNGTQGSGTTIEDRIAFCEGLSEAIKERLA